MAFEGRRKQRAVPLPAIAAAFFLASALSTAAVAAWRGQEGLPAPPRRIVSLVPAVTEMLFAMGAGSSVVGVSSFDNYPVEARSRPRVGALIDPDVERILSLRPDLVVVYSTQDDLIRQLGRAGVRTFGYQHADLADITATVRRLGRLIDHGPEAERVALSIEREIAAVATAIAGRARPRTALLFGRETGTLRSLFASGGVGFMHDMLVAAGGDDVFGDVKLQNLQISIETLLARAPAVIIEAHASEGWTPERIERDLALWRTLPGVPAVRANRVHILADDRLSIPGPRVGVAIRVLAEVLHPEIKR